MLEQAKKTDCLKVCATCPWLTKNQGMPHPKGWYRKANLIRLWNGIRTGKAPGMICHSTDSKAPEYGGNEGIKPGIERECGGAIGLVCIEMSAANSAKDFRAYTASRSKPLTKWAVAAWLERYLLGRVPSVQLSDGQEIGMPWEQAAETVEVAA